MGRRVICMHDRPFVLRLGTIEISWTKSDQCISKILIRFGSFLAFFEKIQFGLI